MIFSRLHRQVPQYVLDFCQPASNVMSQCHLRSAGQRLLNVLHKGSTFALRAFSVAGQLVWNSLPDYLRDLAVDRVTFCEHLRTFLLRTFLFTVY